MDLVPHWIHICGVPLNLCHKENMIKLGSKVGEVMEYEDSCKHRGFLKIKVEVDINLPIVARFWLPRVDMPETWMEYQYREAC